MDWKVDLKELEDIFNFNNIIVESFGKKKNLILYLVFILFDVLFMLYVGYLVLILMKLKGIECGVVWGFFLFWCYDVSNF